MVFSIGFYLLAIVVIGAALAVVVMKDVFRAALAMVLCLVAVAGIYITLNADFLAGAQILVYVGAISILLILGIMLTREVQQGSPANKYKIPAFITAVAFFGIMCFAFLKTPWQESAAAVAEPTTATLAARLFAADGFILPVEITGVLILAAVIGAIVMAKEK